MKFPKTRSLVRIVVSVFVTQKATAPPALIQPWESIEDKIDMSNSVLLGTGGNAKVWSCTCNGMPRALKKFVNDEGDVEEEIVENEMHNQSMHRHPNIVQTFGTFRKGQTLCSLMELADLSLFDLVWKASKGMVWEDKHIAYVLGELAKGLNHIHKCNIIHRDIKSGNILLFEHGDVKISDFGASIWVRDMDDEDELPYNLAGTENWEAPEVLKKAPYTTKADMYSFGVVTLELIYHGDLQGFKASFEAARKGQVKLPSSCSLELRQLVTGCLALSPSSRFSAEKVINSTFVRQACTKAEFSVFVEQGMNQLAALQRY
jgi:serine/threonine protein kinase